jgi:hypothetical protein
VAHLREEVDLKTFAQDSKLTFLWLSASFQL